MNFLEGLSGTKNELFNFENAAQLKEKLDSLAKFSILAVIPMKYKAAEMGESEKLVSVIIIYQ